MLRIDVKTSLITNTAFSVSLRIANVLVKVLLIPLIIAKFGLDGFGVWNLLVSVTNYPRFGIGGAQAAFQKYVSDATATGDFETASKLLSTGSVLVFLVTSIVSLPLLIFTEALVELLKIPGEYAATFSPVLRLLVVVIVISNSMTAFDATISGAHRMEINKKIGIIWLIIETVLVIALLFRGYGLLALAVPFAISELGHTLSKVYFARRILPQISLSPRYFSRGVVKDLIGFAGSFQLMGALEMLYMTLAPALVMRYSGASMSGLYATGSRVITLASVAGESLLLPLLSGSAYVVAKGESTRIDKLFNYSVLFLVFSSLPLMLFASFFADPILFAWTGEKNQLFMASMFLLAGIGLSSLLARHHMIIYRSRGERTLDVMWMVIRLVFLGIVGVVCARYLGYIGLLSAQLMGELVGLIFMMFVMHRLFQIDFLGMGRRWCGQMVVTLVMVLALWRLSSGLFETWSGRTGTLVLLALVSTLYVSLVGAWLWLRLTREERQEVRLILRRRTSRA